MTLSRFICTILIGLPSLLNAADGSATSEVYRNIIIEAGKTVTVESDLDFSTADRVAVTARCISCTSANNSLNGLVMHAAWAVPDALVFCPTEMKNGTTFNYFDGGGAMFQVYGPKLRLTLQNKDSQGIVIHQLTIFRRP